MFTRRSLSWIVLLGLAPAALGQSIIFSSPVSTPSPEREAIYGSLATQGLLGPRSKVYFVDSGAAAGANAPGDYLAPCATISAAVAKCVTGRGDVIVVAPTHAENWSASALPPVIDKSNLSIIASAGAAVTFAGSDDTVTCSITGSNVRIRGLQLNCNNAGLDAMIGITGTNVTIEECIFTQSTTQNVDAYITLTGSTGTVIRNNRCHAPTATNNSGAFVQFLALPVRPLIDGNLVTGLYSLAAVYAGDTIGVTAGTIQNNRIHNLHATGLAVHFVYANAAVVAQINNNYVNCVAAAVATRTAITVSATAVVAMSQNFGHDGAGVDSGLLNPVADS